MIPCKCVLIGFALLSVQLLYAEPHFKHADTSEYEALLERVISTPIPQISRDYPFVEKSDDTRERDIAIETYAKDIEIRCINDLKKKDILPQITLIAERHTCPNCHINRINRALDAREGSSIFATEGKNEAIPIEETEAPFFPYVLDKLKRSGKKAYGLETAAISELKDFIDLILRLKTEASDGHVKVGDLSKRLSANYEDHLSYKLAIVTLKLMNGDLSGFNKTIISQLSSDDKEFSKNFAVPFESMITDFSAAQKNQDVNGALQVISNFLEKFTYDQIMELYQRILNNGLNTIAADKDLQKELPPKLVTILAQKSINNIDLSLIGNFFQDIQRNKNFATNILEIYCSHAIKSSLPLVVQMGAYHEPAVNYLLNQTLRTNKINIKINRVDDFMIFSEMPPSERRKHLKVEIEKIERRLLGK